MNNVVFFGDADGILWQSKPFTKTKVLWNYMFKKYIYLRCLSYVTRGHIALLERAGVYIFQDSVNDTVSYHFVYQRSCA